MILSERTRSIKRLAEYFVKCYRLLHCLGQFDCFPVIVAAVIIIIFFFINDNKY